MKASVVLIQKIGNRSLWLDTTIKDEFMKFISENDKIKKRWRHLSQVILENKFNKDQFKKEDINENCRDVWAIRFINFGNARIYCKMYELADKRVCIVATRLHLQKKNTKNEHKERTLINQTGDTQHELPTEF